MNKTEVRAFARLIKRLSCKQLKALLKKLSRRLSTASAVGGWIFRAKLIRSLKAKMKMVKARIRVKCRPSSTTGGLLGKLKACKKKAAQKYPLSGGWLQRARIMAKRKTYIRKCMRPTSSGGFIGGLWGGFDGQYSNMPGPLGTNLPIPAVGITPPPNPIHTIPGQPYTSIPRPSVPQIVKPPMTIMPKPPRGFISGWPNYPSPVNRQVPYHTHNIYETAPVQGGYATTGPISSPYVIPRPVRPGDGPLRPERPGRPVYGNYTGTGKGLATGSSGMTRPGGTGRPIGPGPSGMYRPGGTGRPIGPGPVGMQRPLLGTGVWADDIDME